jgi:hypothetical protein
MALMSSFSIFLSLEGYDEDTFQMGHNEIIHAAGTTDDKTWLLLAGDERL